MAPTQLLITGDYYQGATGPTIIMFLKSTEAAEWLQTLFRDIAHRGEARVITGEPEVQITGVDRIVLARRSDAGGPSGTLRRVAGGSRPSFDWNATMEGWLYLSDLVQPFTDGITGHHYLADDGIGDAVIELSYGEPHPTQ